MGSLIKPWTNLGKASPLKFMSRMLEHPGGSSLSSKKYNEMNTGNFFLTQLCITVTSPYAYNKVWYKYTVLSHKQIRPSGVEGWNCEKKLQKICSPDHSRLDYGDNNIEKALIQNIYTVNSSCHILSTSSIHPFIHSSIHLSIQEMFIEE